MTRHRLRLQRPEDLPAAPRDDDARELEVQTDPDELEGIRRDAAALEGRGARGLLRPRSEGSLARWLRAHEDTPLLVQGALTSLTGGATPDGDVVVSTARMSHLQVHRERRRATAGAGLVLANLQEQLAEQGLYYPPAPTHDGATIGGNVATNAAGAATFKYGTTRSWVERIRMILRHGDLLEIARGQCELRAGDRLRLEGSRTIELELPSYRSPAIKKSAVGYYVTSPMDAIDLLIGSEGTLGIITEVELAVVPEPRVVTGLCILDSLERAIELTGELRRRSEHTRAAPGSSGLDVRSIELFDHRCLELIRDEGKLEAIPLEVPAEAAACLLFEQEVDRSLDEQALFDRLADALEGHPHADDPLGEIVEVLASFDAVERTEMALPSQTRRRRQLAEVREAIPLSVSDWLVRRNQSHPEVHKVAGDMIVPFPRFGDMMRRYYDEFARRNVDVAIFGHISDGNVHPNTLPADGTQMASAEAALLELADVAKALGGCPLSEHGVGKHPLKKQMLARFWSAAALEEMRAIKRAFDPSWTLARGVFFDP